MAQHYGRSFAQACFIIGLLAAAATAPAQYFGQNKVRYRTFNFEVLETERFKVHYYDDRETAVRIGRMAERWYARLSKVLEHDLPPEQPLIIYNSHTDFRGTTVIPGYIGETTGGVTEGLKRRVIMPLGDSWADTDHVLGHELVHAFQYHITTPQTASGMAIPGIAMLPLWFVEGMAEYLSLGPVDPHTAMWLRDAVRREAVPDIAKLDHPRYFPYRYGHAFWAYVGGRYGDEVIGRMLRSAGGAGSVPAAIQSVLGISKEQLSADWREALTNQYEDVLAHTQAPDNFGRELLAGREREGRLNVGPALSPDGRKIAFFSERGLFAIDMYVADAETGEIVRRVTQTAVDPHFDAFQWIESAGAWSHDSLRLAYATVARGRPQLTIYDVGRGRDEQKIRFPDLTEITNPSWAPDGRRIAFSGMRDGQVDLYVVDMHTGDIERLTDDIFSHMQAAWSPDGKSIAFVTDQFSSDVGALQFGGSRLAIYDWESTRIELLEGFPDSRHVSPQWSPDSQSLYFVSDPQGVANVFRLRLDSGEIRQITNVHTGVSGIAASSPSLSVTAETERIAFSVFQADTYSIFVTDREQAEGTAVRRDFERNLAAALPPLDRRPSEVAALLESPATGLVTPEGFDFYDYKPSLKLDYIAPPNISVGMTTFGSLVGAGTALYWSDMLGQHSLMTAFQTTSATDGTFFNNITAVGAYTNMKHRWNWGFVGGQVPFMFGDVRQGLGEVDGEPAVIEQSTLNWQIERQAAAIFAYPFSRAQRLEFASGFQNISFDSRGRITAFSRRTGQILADQRTDLPTPDSLNMAMASTALVYDTSIFGGTSPIKGQSYRLELGGFAGSLDYINGLADYRKYFQVARPLTFAARALHFGRYGGDAQDQRMQSLFLGFPTMIRGYTPGSFSPAECGEELTTTGRCPVFDQLFGSRIGVANLEARIPLTGPLGLWTSPGVPPVEIAPFFDAGFAWIDSARAQALDRPRRPVSSYGVSARFNVLGFTVVQLSYVKPNHRPLQDWMWEFAIAAGF